MIHIQSVSNWIIHNFETLFLSNEIRQKYNFSFVWSRRHWKKITTRSSFFMCLTLCGRTSLICGRMSPLTTTPIYQLAIKASISASPSVKSPECHPYVTTSYVSSLVQRRRPEKAKETWRWNYHSMNVSGYWNVIRKWRMLLKFNGWRLHLVHHHQQEKESETSIDMSFLLSMSGSFVIRYKM